jgi:DNA polymerase-3 subunit delta'
LHQPLPWHHAQWSRICARVAAGRLPHALLLVGPRGMGKAAFAWRLARAVLCERSNADGEACGACSSCVLALAGNHPDLRLAEPEMEVALRDWPSLPAVPMADPDRKTDEPRKTRVISVGQIRSLTSYMVETSQYGRGKVALIHPADAMNINAANALLKTLEEPPGGNLLLLVTDRPSGLPPTVRSRCQPIPFAVPDTATSLTWLAERCVALGDLVLALAGGAPMRALELAQTGALEVRRGLFEAWRRLAGGAGEVSAVAKAWVDRGLRTAFYWLQGWIADMIRLRLAPGRTDITNTDLCEALHTLAAGLNLQFLYARLDHALAAYRLASTQVNPQLLAEDVLVPWSQAGFGRESHDE